MPKKAKQSRVSAKADQPVKPPKDSCFTIMPFGGWFDDYYAAVYKPAIEDAGLTPCRADDLYRPSAIVHDIWAYTRAAKLILADLTGKNPNVFYELGLGHAIAKPAILVVETMADVPFDLRALRVIEYNKNSPDWGATLKSKITASIKEVLSAPLESVLPTFLEVKQQSSKPILTPHEKELIEIKQELDVLRRQFRERMPSMREREEIEVRRSLPPEEAEDLIRQYLDMGLPRESIIQRVARPGGPPSGWVSEKIRLLKRKK
jgi:hypothetical protein